MKSNMKKIKNPYVGLEKDGYNCFACCPSNPIGLRMEFYEDGDDIVSFWKPGEHYQSWVKTLHGGIQATLLDEMGGWVVNRKLQTAGMTIRLNMKYKKPAPVEEGVEYELRARIKEMKRNLAVIDATLSHEGEICSEAEMIYFCYPKDVAAKDFFFTSCDLEEEVAEAQQ